MVVGIVVLAFFVRSEIHYRDKTRWMRDFLPGRDYVSPKMLCDYVSRQIAAHVRKEHSPPPKKRKAKKKCVKRKTGRVKRKT